MDRWETYNRLASMGPVQSVDELIDRIEAEQMPIYQMRFFINEDRREPRCFGLYHDEGTDRWIVYKNKSDGSRAIRLQTPDEAQAAQEIWEKILSEIRLRLEQGKGPWIQAAQSAPEGSSAAGSSQTRRSRGNTVRSTGRIWLIILIFLFFLFTAVRNSTSGGGSVFSGGGYYSSWSWDDDDGWSWDDDDDDWDSGWDSWDSGGTDWDSDW